MDSDMLLYSVVNHAKMDQMRGLNVPAALQ